MLRLPVQQIQRVRHQFHHCFQRFHRAAGTAREIQNQGLAPHPTHPATQRREFSLLETLASHPFGHAVNHALTDRFCCLRSNVALCNAGPAGGYNESHFQRQMDECVLNLHGIVLHDLFGDHVKAELLQRLGNCWP